MRLTAVLLLAIIQASCESGLTDVGREALRTPASSLTVTPLSVTLVLGESSQLTAVARDFNGALLRNPPIKWISLVPSTVAVDANGKITAIGKGSAVIRASVDSQTAQAVVTVSMPLAQLWISTTGFDAAIGETHPIEARALDANNALIPGIQIQWTSSAPAVASVSNSNATTNVTALSAGTTTITATAEGRTATAVVIVGAVQPLGGLWDFTDNLNATSAQGATCADTGSILFTGAGSILGGKAFQSGKCARGLTLYVNQLPATILPWQVKGREVRFTLVYGNNSSCSYLGQLDATRSEMNGTANCSLSTGTWRAVRGRPVTSLVLTTNIPNDSILPDDRYLMSVRPLTATGPAFLRPIVWRTSNANVAVPIASANPETAEVLSVSPGTATISAHIDDVQSSKVITVHEVSIASISVSASRSCGTSGSGQVYCWAYGAPRLFFTGPVLSALSVGAGVICGLTASFVAHCWNDQDGLLPGSRIPAVETSLRFSSISAGGYEYDYYDYSYPEPFVCGIAEQGQAYCWGVNSSGALGIGSNRDKQTTPVAVATSERFRAISAGVVHTCGINTSGRAYCWGVNRTGSLGYGGPSDRDTPVEVETPVTFDSIYAGSDNTCALTAAGAAWCWGSNTMGQLSQATNAPFVLTPIDVSAGRSFRSLAVGGHFICGLTTDNDVYCWGGNHIGQLGQGTSSAFSATPLKVKVPEKLVSISAGGNSLHACGMTATQRVYCWGYPWMLGNSLGSSHGPVRLPGQR